MITMTCLMGLAVRVCSAAAAACASGAPNESCSSASVLSARRTPCRMRRGAAMGASEAASTSHAAWASLMPGRRCPMLAADQQLAGQYRTQLLKVVNALRGLSHRAHVDGCRGVQSAVLGAGGLERCQGAAPARPERLPGGLAHRRSPASDDGGL